VHFPIFIDILVFVIYCPQIVSECAFSWGAPFIWAVRFLGQAEFDTKCEGMGLVWLWVYYTFGSGPDYQISISAQHWPTVSCCHCS